MLRREIWLAALDPTIGAEIGARIGRALVLEGSVRKAGNRVRIAGQLIDTVSGAHIWADRFG